jgi:hypothetical protein
LAAFDYDWLGVTSHALGERTKTQLLEWMSKGQKANFTAIIVPDPAFFEPPDARDRPISVDLARVRRALNGRSKPPLDFRALAHAGRHPAFVFAQTTFHLTTKPDAKGEAAVAIVFWKNGRLLDAFSTNFCVGIECYSRIGNKIGSEAFEPIRQAISMPKATTASLTFANLGDDGIIGLFRVNDAKPVRTMSWKLGVQQPAFTSRTHSSLVPFGNASSEEQRRLSGIALFNILFPRSASAEREAFLQFALPLLKNNPRSAAEAPSMFVSFVGHGTGDFEVIPAGLIAVPLPDGGSEFLGYHFRIEQPLPRQEFAASRISLRHWMFLVPGDDAGGLADAGRAVKRSVLDKWSAIQKPFASMNQFGEWLAEDGSTPPGTAIFLLCHHSQDVIWFSKSDQISTAVVTREFSAPAFAILNACGTGDVGASDLVERLNDHGVSAIVATSAEIPPELAVAFLRSFAAVVAEHQSTRYSVGEAYFDTLIKLRQSRADDRDDSLPTFGSSVLVYVILGNSNVRISLPKEAR